MEVGRISIVKNVKDVSNQLGLIVSSVKLAI